MPGLSALDAPSGSCQWLHRLLGIREGQGKLSCRCRSSAVDAVPAQWLLIAISHVMVSLMHSLSDPVFWGPVLDFFSSTVAAAATALELRCSMASFHLTLEENGRYLTVEVANLLQQQCVAW